MTSNIFITDLRSSEMDDACGMRYWLNAFEGGRGMVKKEQVVPDAILEATKGDLRMLASMEDISEGAIQACVDDILSGLSADDKKDFAKMELLYRRLGWFAAFALYVEPELREKWETISIDEQIILDRDPLWVVCTPDRLLRNKASGEIVYREYMPMPHSLTNQKWLHAWLYNPRLHVGMAAVNDHLEKHGPPSTIAYGEVMGMSKGWMSQADGKLSHPYVRGYYNPENVEWTHSAAQLSTVNGGHWETIPVWDFPGGIIAWVKLCGEGVAKQQFGMSPAVILNEDMVHEWVARRIHRERQINITKDISHINTYLRQINFERRTFQCYLPNGDVCPYLKACWHPEVGKEPFKSGEYVPNIMNERVEVKVGEIVQ